MAAPRATLLRAARTPARRGLGVARWPVAAALVAMVAGCQLLLPSVPPSPEGASPAPSQSAGAPASVSPAMTRFGIVAEYVAALRAKDYESAWALLGHQTQGAYGSLDEFTQYQRALQGDTHANIVI